MRKCLCNGHLPFAAFCRTVAVFVGRLAPLFDLLVRLYLARVFFLSGLTKIRSWDGTLYLFTSEYHVPLLPPLLAAVMATSAELAFPVLLVLGWRARFAALGLFILNTVAVISYYPAMGELGLKDHLMWGVLLAMLLFHGAGNLSFDAWLCRKNTGACQS
ncbi:MAG: DoxX family protein [Formivibrio sp.]|nr:DoxX family protein [Formivibrio sp.]